MSKTAAPVTGAGGAADDTRAQLEAERDFLLKSLDDLEAERAAGGIDDESYRALHDDYTARAAATIRALRDGIDARPVAPPIPWRRRVVVIGMIVVFAVGAGLALAAALGARLPGQTSSGNTGASSRATSRTSTKERRRELAAAVARKPDDVAARFLLAQFLEADNDLRGALEQYQAVIRLQPTNAVAYAQSGRILYLAATGAGNQAAGLVDQARARLDQAIQLDPQYPDARFFRAIVLANEYQDFRDAQSDLQRYLVAAPNGEFADQARQLLAQVTAALESPTTTTTGK